MAILEWQEEIAGDSADLVETEWDAELDKRLQDVENGGVELVDHSGSMRAARKRPVSRRSCRKARLPKVRKELDPSFYGDLESFRKAVADGTVDVAKGCRDMGEYHLSLERRHV